MWLNWLPWRYIVRRMARARGFFDPVVLLSRLQNFSQPSEVAVPLEVMRIAGLLQARGLINSQAIQHNLDWVWPYWVEEQFDPRSRSFIPRAFSLTHINLTNRNWTAVGMPGISQLPIVDPRGLVTPLYDGWSLDFWVLGDDGSVLLPSKAEGVEQRLRTDETLSVCTRAGNGTLALDSEVRMIRDQRSVRCSVHLQGCVEEQPGWLAVAVRPCNPEGISFVHSLEFLTSRKRWAINRDDEVLFHADPDFVQCAQYHEGDVFHRLRDKSGRKKVECKVGMATGASLFRLEPGRTRQVIVEVPLPVKEKELKRSAAANVSWTEELRGRCRLVGPRDTYRSLYETALRTLVLHSPYDIYPGPYTYKRFWFRDAVFIMHAMLCAGLSDRVRMLLSRFFGRQTPTGYFASQEGEWDSNGQVLWLLQRYCELTGEDPPKNWMGPVERAARWIQRKRISDKKNVLHAGLIPSGFSAEHLGPNDFYYWDDFWCVKGLQSAAFLFRAWNKPAQAIDFLQESELLQQAVDRSLARVRTRLSSPAMPASPYRRLDSGSVGSLACGYPLQLCAPDDERLLKTVDYLLEHCFVEGGFFHDMSHSGINPYLTLHIAQVLLRTGDARFAVLMDTIARLASSTGQWPEAIHPQTGSGCMGDGQHVWAAAEWVLMLRNCVVREEGPDLVVGGGVESTWVPRDAEMFFGPAPTSFGTVTVRISSAADRLRVTWDAKWRNPPRRICVRFPGFPPEVRSSRETGIEIARGARS